MNARFCDAWDSGSGPIDSRRMPENMSIHFHALMEVQVDFFDTEAEDIGDWGDYNL